MLHIVDLITTLGLEHTNLTSNILRNSPYSNSTPTCPQLPLNVISLVVSVAFDGNESASLLDDAFVNGAEGTVVKGVYGGVELFIAKVSQSIDDHGGIG